MRKFIKNAIVTVVAVATMMSTTTAFASTNYTNSVGSEASDITILEDSTYTVKGSDTTQNKKSKYTTVEYSDEAITSNCDVYATIAEGSKVYDPENPDADENGFVDGSILVGLPTVLIMGGTPDADGNYTATGKGKVKGNIAGTTVINVVPDSSFNMSQTGKADINATVEQNYTKFTVSSASITGTEVNKNVTPSFNDNAVFDVKVYTDEATAGSWKGSFNYTVSVDTI